MIPLNSDQTRLFLPKSKTCHIKLTSNIIWQIMIAWLPRMEIWPRNITQQNQSLNDLLENTVSLPIFDTHRNLSRIVFSISGVEIKFNSAIVVPKDLPTVPNKVERTVYGKTQSLAVRWLVILWCAQSVNCSLWRFSLTNLTNSCLQNSSEICPVFTRFSGRIRLWVSESCDKPLLDIEWHREANSGTLNVSHHKKSFTHRIRWPRGAFWLQSWSPTSVALWSMRKSSLIPLISQCVPLSHCVSPSHCVCPQLQNLSFLGNWGRKLRGIAHVTRHGTGAR